nr:4Fe-4S binding protein [Desulfuromonadales bacterium]
MTFTHPLAFLEEVLASRVLLVSFAVTALVPLAVTLVFGRVFCSWFCPVGCALELVQGQSRRRRWPASRRRFRFRDERLVLLGILLVLSLALGLPVLANLDPPHVLGRELMTLGTFGTLSLAGSGFLAAILLLDVIVFSRGWCNYLCPSGGGLALLGRWRRLRIRLDKKLCTRCGDCDRICPYYLEPQRLMIDEPFDWQKCDNCGLCRDVCPEGAIRYTMKKE